MRVKPDILIAGAGLSGSVIARYFAEQGKYVLILEKRGHIAGNLYDFYDENGILVQKYGPHIFQTNKLELFAYVRQFADWFFFNINTLAMIDGQYTPCPFNFKTIDQFYNFENARELKERLHKQYNSASKVTIVELINSEDKLIREFAHFLFEKDYKLYTAKQWGMPAESVDVSILKRVPIRLSYEELFFDSSIQVLPQNGFTKFIENVLANNNIHVETYVNAANRIQTKNNFVYFDGEKFNNPVIYTGPIDELLQYKYGVLPYRSLKFEFDYKEASYYQPAAMCAYPQENGYTRITEYTQLPHQGNGTIAVFAREYPTQHDPHRDTDPYYPIVNEDNYLLYNKYKDQLVQISNFYLCGRLAEYKYYYMDQALESAIKLCKVIDYKWFN
jgi:UDP-galactopyranose mutase